MASASASNCSPTPHFSPSFLLPKPSPDMQVLLVIPASALQTALASASDDLRQQTSDLIEMLMDDPGLLMSMGFMGGPNGAADSWSTRLNLDPEVG
jgi:hypothetical protein